MAIPFSRQSEFSGPSGRIWTYRNPDAPLKTHSFAGSVSTRLAYNGFIHGISPDPEHTDIIQGNLGSCGGGGESLEVATIDSTGTSPCGVSCGLFSTTTAPPDPIPIYEQPLPHPLWTTFPIVVTFLGSQTTYWYGWHTNTIVEDSSDHLWVKEHQKYDFTATVSYSITIETEEWRMVTCQDLPDFLQGAPTFTKLKVMDRITYLQMVVDISGLPSEFPGSEAASGDHRILTFTLGASGVGSGEDSDLCPTGFAPWLRLKGSKQHYIAKCNSVMGLEAFCDVGSTGAAYEENLDVTDAYGLKHILLSPSRGRVEATSGNTIIANPAGVDSFPPYIYCDQYAAANLEWFDKHEISIKLTGSVNAFGADFPATDLPYSVDLPFNALDGDTPMAGLSDGTFSYQNLWNRWDILNIFSAWGFQFTTEQIDIVQGPQQFLSPTTESGENGPTESAITANLNPLWLCAKGWNENHRRILFQGDSYPILKIQHLQSLSLTGSSTGAWELVGDMTQVGDVFSSPSGTGSLQLTFDTPFDCEGYRYLHFDMTTLVNGNISLDMWSNKEAFNHHTGHTGKMWTFTGSSNTGESRTIEIDLCSPHNPTRNADEYPDWPYDAWSPGGTPAPGRDPQNSRFPFPLEKRCIVSLPGVVPDTFGNTYQWRSDSDGPLWGIGGPGLKVLALTGFTAGEKYKLSIPTLFVKNSDIIDMISGYENTRMKPTSEDLGEFAENFKQFCILPFTGFKGCADGKITLEEPTIIIAPEDSLPRIYSTPFEGVDLNIAGSNDDTNPWISSVTIGDLCNLINKHKDWGAELIPTSHVFNNQDRPAAILFGQTRDALNIDLTSGPVTCYAQHLYDAIYRDDEQYELTFNTMIGMGFQGIVVDPTTYLPNPNSGMDAYYFLKYAPDLHPFDSSIPVEIDQLELWGTGATDDQGYFKTDIPFRCRGPVQNELDGDDVQPTCYVYDESRPDITLAHDPSAADSATPPGLSVAIIEPDAILRYPFPTTPAGEFDGLENVQFAERCRHRIGLYSVYVAPSDSKKRLYVSKIDRGFMGHGRLMLSDGTHVSTSDCFDVGPNAVHDTAKPMALGFASAGLRPGTGEFHQFYARAFGSTSNIYYRWDPNSGPSSEKKLISGSFPAVSYMPHGEICLIFCDGSPTHVYSVILQRTGSLTDPSFAPDLSTRFDFGAADLSGNAVECLPSGILQMWFAKDSVLQTYVSINGGRSWTVGS